MAAANGASKRALLIFVPAKLDETPALKMSSELSNTITDLTPHPTLTDTHHDMHAGPGPLVRNKLRTSFFISPGEVEFLSS